MKESKISYSARVMIEMIVSGFIWIGAAASFMVMLKRGTLVSKIVMLSILIILSILKIIASRFRENQGDEMSKAHYQKIRADSYSSIIGIIISWGIIVIIADFLGFTLVHNWFSWLLILIGIEEMIMGMRFYRLEKKGDDY